MQKTRTYSDRPYPFSGQPAFRTCDHPGCTAEGMHRAPRSRQNLTSYFWFCLDHVREYNKGWNYCAGMSSDEIEAHMRQDVVWHRPTWRFGTRGGEKAWVAPEDIQDPLGIFGAQPKRPNDAAHDPNARFWPPGSPEARALKVLDLAGPVTLGDVKARYKELAKRHHPDANGGCKKSEERLKSINEAYMTLRKTLSS